jgi:hypothetical protein
VWIWNAVQDRFPDARQCLDLYHGDEHLWTVADDLYGRGTPEAAEWVAPLLKQVRKDQTPAVIKTLQELQPRLTRALRKKVQTQIEYCNEPRLAVVTGMLPRQTIPWGLIRGPRTTRELRHRAKTSRRAGFEPPARALLRSRTHRSPCSHHESVCDGTTRYHALICHDPHGRDWRATPRGWRGERRCRSR